MLDFNSLIGLEKDEAVRILNKNGYNKIDMVISSKSNELCDSLLVVKAEEKNDKVRLVLGEFYLKIKG